MYCCLCSVSRRVRRSYFSVVAGLNVLSAPDLGDGTQIRSIREVRIHKDYNNVTADNDVTLLLLSAPFNFTDHVQPVCTPLYDAQESFLNFSHCFISGWGSPYFKGWFKNSIFYFKGYDDDPESLHKDLFFTHDVQS